MLILGCFLKIELISIELPHEYEKESWQLNDNEKTNTVQKYRDLGNELYRNGKIAEAEEKYRAALAIVEQLLVKYALKVDCFFLLLLHKFTDHKNKCE